MPRKKVTDGTASRKRSAGKKRGRDEFSSDDDLELDGSPGSDGGPNNKRGPNKGGANKAGSGAAAVVVTEPEHTKEKIVSGPIMLPLPPYTIYSSFISPF